MTDYPGLFITVEGLDGCGKTTAVDHIEQEFGAERTCEPSEFWTGKQVRRALQEDTPAFTDFFLFMADRHYHIEELIKPALIEGKTVVSSRFADSTLAYQPVQLKHELDYPVSWMLDVMEPWNIEPDLTIYLDISVDTALERADREEKYETRTMLEQVEKNYERIIEDNSHRYVVIDGEQPKRQMLQDVRDAVAEKIHNDYFEMRER